jgi:SAM-dependent methyltransferase
MINSAFKPSVFHPYYFIRKGLFQKINQHKSVLTGKLLDFGCGSKPYKSLINNVSEYVGVDFENEGHPHDNEQIDIFYDGKSIPVQNDFFDSALSSEVFEHIFNLEDVLKELNRVMKPGAPILITCPFLWKEHEVPNDFARYTHYALQHLFEKNGFTVETKDKSGNFVEVTFQLQVLFFHDKFYLKIHKVPVVNFLFRFFFFAIPNSVGAIASKIFPKTKTLYFNNIVIARKN